MARRKRKRFGDPTEVHSERAKSTLREIRRLMGAVKRHLRAPADCATASRLAISLAQQQGAYLIDRASGRGRARFVKGASAVIDKVLRECVLKPRSEAHKRKIHAVWR
jgi:hypothetical protein